MIKITDEMRELLVEYSEGFVSEDVVAKRIIELHEASNPKPEPVAWVDMSLYPPIRFKNGSIRAYFVELEGMGLYTHPPTQEPLTEEKCNELFQWYAMQSNLFPGSIKPIDMIRAVEKAHKIGV